MEGENFPVEAPPVLPKTRGAFYFGRSSPEGGVTPKIFGPGKDLGFTLNGGKISQTALLGP